MSNSERWTFLALLASLLLIPSALADEEVSAETCLACHAVEGLSNSAGRPLLVVDAESFNVSVHGPLPCTICHADATSVPHEVVPKAVELEGCATCHEGVVDHYQLSVHGRAHENGAKDAATCTSCHGSPHAIRKATDPASPVYPLTLPRTCGVCHGDADLAKRHGIPLENAYQLYMDSIHGRALTKSGLLVAANCSSCHGSHDIMPKESRDSRISKNNIPSTCGACHAGLEDEYAEDVHGRAVADGNFRSPVCVDCHTAHEIERVETVPWKLQIVRECGTCHEESLRTYRDTFHGQVTALGFTVVARCSDCHGSHQVLPASDPKSLIAPANLVATCQRCHPGANANFVLYSPHADHENPERNPGLYYTARLMELLIVGVFIFFGVHTVMWLLRSLIEHRGPSTPS